MSIRRICSIATLFAILLVGSRRAPFILVSGNSMEPTYQNEQFVGVKYNTSNLKRGDVAIFKQAVHSSIDEKLIKRVCGIPGDDVYIDEDGVFFIYDATSDCVYYYNGDYSKDQLLETSTYQYTLETDEYFFMGDNRDESLDSRNFGAIKHDKIIATVSNSYVEPEAL